MITRDGGADVAGGAGRGLRILSVCSGTGQLDVGVRSVFPTARTTLYVEREGYAAAILAARMASGDLDRAPVWSDLRCLPARALAGRVDMVVGGVPCQPVSRAGRRRGVEDERWLWPVLWDVIRTTGATSLFLENVPGFVKHGLAAVADDLAEHGWDAEWDVLPASEVGAQQIRFRFFLLGRAHGARLPDPEPARLAGAASRQHGAGPAVGESGRASVSALRPPGRDDHRAWRSVLARRPWLSPAVESALCRDTDAMATGDHMHLRGVGCGEEIHGPDRTGAVEGRGQETSAAPRHGGTLFGLRHERGTAGSPPSEHPGRAPQGGDRLPAVSSHAGYAGRATPDCREGDLYLLRSGVSAQAQQPCCCLHGRGVPTGAWSAGSEEPMGRPLEDPSLYRVRAGVHAETYERDRMQQILWEQERMAAQACGCPRAHRLRAIGNGCVPEHVAYGLRTLLARLGADPPAPPADQLPLAAAPHPPTDQARPGRTDRFVMTARSLWG